MSFDWKLWACSVVPFKGHEARQLSAPVILFQSQHFLPEKQETQPATVLMVQAHHRLAECHKDVPCFVLCPFPWKLPCFFKHQAGVYAGHTYSLVSLLSGSNQFRHCYRLCKVRTWFPHHLAFICSVFDLLFYCLVTHSSLQMTLTPANLKKFCIVSKRSHLAAHPFLRGSNESSSTA